LAQHAGLEHLCYDVGMPRKYFKVIPAVYILLRRDNEILLLRRANTGYQDGKYSFPAGHMDGGELAKLAMLREAREEVDVEINEKDLKFVHITSRLNGDTDNERIDLFFEAWKWSGEIKNNEPDKCTDVQWFNINNLPEDIIPYIKIVLESVLDGEYYSEFPIEP
jgi:8-oxo-dGTP pyrophosphatase MutT (NUDIX family)